MKAIKVRIYPTKEQSVLINKTFGCCRFIYNTMLAEKFNAYSADGTNISSYDLIKRITIIKQQPEYEWLKEVENMALQQSVLDLDKAYKTFFRAHKGFPKYHKKGIKDSYRTFSIQRNSQHSIKLPKVGIVKTAEPIKKKWNIHNATISKRAGQYFVSLLIDYTPPKKVKTGEMVGIDVGIKTFAVLSNGIEYENIKTLSKHEDKLARLQRQLSRTQKGSKNREKAKLKVAQEHLKIANIRNDYLHKVSSEIANQYSLVAVEDLNINGMLKNHKLAKSIADCSWGEFIRQLEYKCEWYGCELRKIGRFEPSSKLCSNCGYKMESMPLQIRFWTCPVCGCEHDRDLNAANNILNISLSGRQVESIDTVNNSSLEWKNLEVAF